MLLLTNFLINDIFLIKFCRILFKRISFDVYLFVHNVHGDLSSIRASIFDLFNRKQRKIQSRNFNIFKNLQLQYKLE